MNQENSWVLNFSWIIFFLNFWNFNRYYDLPNIFSSEIKNDAKILYKNKLALKEYLNPLFINESIKTPFVNENY